VRLVRHDGRPALLLLPRRLPRGCGLRRQSPPGGSERGQGTVGPHPHHRCQPRARRAARARRGGWPDVRLRAVRRLAVVDPPRLSFRLDGHWLRVNSSKDFVYSGGGATSNTFFGYTSTPTHGRNELAYLTHLTLGIQATQNVLLNLFYAHVWGQGIIRSNFVGNDANYGYAEMVFTY